jgi:two-component system, cell cycle sensor histidine kinase and response regulator CckA
MALEAVNWPEHRRILEERLEEAEETIRALTSGEVDAIVVSGPDGGKVYTLRGADEAYRTMVQGMAEGALTLTREGLILFSNEQFATIVGSPLEQVIGCRIQEFVAPGDEDVLAALLTGRSVRKGEVRLRSAVGPVPVYLSAEDLVIDGVESLCMIVTDLSWQKRSEQIVASEKLARSILEQAAEAILVVDPDGAITRASRAAERLAGTALASRRFDDAFRISRESSARYTFADILAATKNGLEIRNVEAAAVTQDGRRLELLLSAALLRDADGAPLVCVINLTDITERKQRERQLKFQADILETTSEAVIAIDPEQRVTFWNSGAEKLYGVSAGDALGKPLADLYEYKWASAEEENRAISILLNHGMWSGENVHVRRDGTEVCVSSTVNRIADEYGGGLFAVIRDITENRRAESVLRESESSERRRAAEMEAIMEAVPAVVSIARDAECREIIGNRMAYEQLRLPLAVNFSKSAPEEERPKNWREVKDGHDIPTEELPMQMAARTGKAVHDYEFDIVFNDGTARCWLGNTVPLFDDSGNSRGAVGVFVDITERKRAEERLRQTQKLESIGLLAGGIAHDFNNLLVGVIGNASLALEMASPEGQEADLLERVIRSGEQLAHLTRQMLAYAGKGRFVLEHLDLSELVPQMNVLIQPSVPKRIGLHFELDRDLPPIEADRGQLQQVFMNLVLNSAEAIGGGTGVISVKTGVRQLDEASIRSHTELANVSPGSYVFLEVRDTGCGMDLATRSRIFDPFFSTKFAGRGLGLAAVGGIVRGHKGAIQVETSPGQGSCFTVLFPALARAKPLPEGARHLAAPPAAGTILVVDDELVVREMTRQALTRYGFDVLVASDGLEAIDVLKRHPSSISLVLLDLSMPGMSGEEALPELWKIRPGVKVIVSSGYSEAEVMAQFKGRRVSGFIQKPYTPVRLAEKVRFTLG